MDITSKGRVLVVDDQPETRELMVRLLTTRGGYEVRTAEDGFDALLQLKGMKPDVIISVMLSLVFRIASFQ
jgi:CheY-like chemotaxis protein